MSLVKLELTQEQAAIILRMIQMTLDNAEDAGFTAPEILAPITGAKVRLQDAINRT